MCAPTHCVGNENALSLVFNSRKPHHTIRTLRDAAKPLAGFAFVGSRLLIRSVRLACKSLWRLRFPAYLVQAALDRNAKAANAVSAFHDCAPKSCNTVMTWRIVLV